MSEALFESIAVLEALVKANLKEKRKGISDVDPIDKQLSQYGVTTTKHCGSAKAASKP